ncbi:hypothetical protein SELMODRAFT_412620 [Selaginella moellendorffii]|uniref:Uncharacterized protein n=1 Tax=Selaginella moellendorffii TaxID=88036 RepID=D8RM31_SELML|nr:hypothetical protein SELMODRAFT_412620 [Selaginella moellendorffii]
MNNPNLGNLTPAKVEVAVNNLMGLSYDCLSHLAGHYTQTLEWLQHYCMRDGGAHLPLTKMSRVVNNKSALEVLDLLVSTQLHYCNKLPELSTARRFPLMEALLASVIHMKGRGIC